MNDFCYEIFKYLKPDENDLLSSFEYHDLQNIIYYIEKYMLEYRSFINIPLDILFGVEIEADSKLSMALCLMNNIISSMDFNDWRVVEEKSISNGFEIVSPVMNNSKDFWKDLKTICLAVKPYGFISNDCGGHVHVGAHVLGENKDNWLKFIKLWASYEHIIYRFCYGEFLTHRSRILGFSQPSSLIFMSDYEKFKDNYNISIDKMIREISHDTKGLAVNFKNAFSSSTFSKGNTIEFRCANGTLNPVIWQNNINLFTHLLMYAKSDNYNETIVSSRFNKIDDSSLKLGIYSKVHLKDAVELADLIFNNNLDKIYFLRQYLKSYEIGTECLEEARPFVKKLI